MATLNNPSVKSSLPASPSQGDLNYVTDNIRGYWASSQGSPANWFSMAGEVVNVKEFGAKADVKSYTDGAITAATATFSSSNAAFTSADVNKLISITGAGPSGGALNTSIQSVSMGVATLAASASTTVASGGQFNYASNDLSAIQNAIDAANGAGGGTILFPRGTYRINGRLTLYSNMLIQGIAGAVLTCNGAYMTATPGEPFFHIDGESKITIQGLKIMGNGGWTGTPFPSPYGAGNCVGFTNQNTGVLIEGTASDIQVLDCEFTGLHHGLFTVGVDTVSRLRFSRNYCHGMGMSGCYFQKCFAAEACENQIMTVQGNQTDPGETNTADSKYADGIYINSSASVLVADNFIYDIIRICVVLEACGSENDSITVSNNRLEYAHDSRGSEVNAGIWSEDGKSLETQLFHGNEILRTSRGIYGNKSDIAGNSIKYCRESGINAKASRMIGNSVMFCGHGFISATQDAAESSMVSGNYFYGNIFNGVTLDRARGNFTIAGNTIENNGAYSGTISVTNASSGVTGIGTAFTKQLAPGSQFIYRLPRTGTISVISGSSSVAGTATAFTTELTTGDILVWMNDAGIIQTATISSVTNDSSLTLTANAASTGTGVVFGLKKTATINSITNDTALALSANATISGSGLRYGPDGNQFAGIHVIKYYNDQKLVIKGNTFITPANNTDILGQLCGLYSESGGDFNLTYDWVTENTFLFTGTLNDYSSNLGRFPCSAVFGNPVPAALYDLIENNFNSKLPQAIANTSIAGYPRFIGFRSSAPVSGTFKSGDYFYYEDWSSGNSMGERCISSGAPGAWKKFGYYESIQNGSPQFRKISLGDGADIAPGDGFLGLDSTSVNAGLNWDNGSYGWVLKQESADPQDLKLVPSGGGTRVFEVSDQLKLIQSNLGSPVLTLTSSATNTDPTEITYQHRVATTDNSPTSIMTFGSLDNYMFYIEAVVIGRRTSGSGNSQDCASYKLAATYKKIGSTPTKVGSVHKTANEDQDWDADFYESGEDILIKVTGGATTSIAWHCTARLYLLSD